VGVNFLDLGMYSGGSFIPNGDYVVFHNVILHQPQDKQGNKKGPERLGVMVDFYPMANPIEENKLQQFYSMGTKAHESYQPNPDTGKGIVAIPGTSGGLNDKTNWFLYIHSLVQSSFPPSLGTNDLTVIDGTWVHISNEDEPADRSSFQSATAEVSQEPRKPNKVAIVTEILEGGAPWEGGGGLEGAAEAHAALNGAAPTPVTPVRTMPRPAARVTPALATRPAPAVARPAARPVAAPAPAPVEPAEIEEVDEAVVNAATDAVYNLLLKSPNGIPRAALRTQTFTEVKKLTKDEAMATQVINTYFEPGGEANLSNLLSSLNHSLVGMTVKPIA